jgi:biotin transport system substrate-specific component
MLIASSAAHSPLIGRLWPAAEDSLARQALLAVAGTILFWASAKVQVPMYPVPMTMQTFVMMVVGMAYGSRLATATVLLYLIEGAVGLPVFAGTPERGIGLAYMMGPTGGFLIGFLIAAYVMGRLADHGWDRTLPHAAAAMAIGTVVQFIPGVTWLALGLGMGWERGWEAGVAPFLVGAIVKMALAAAVLPLAWRAVESRDITN